MTATDTQTSPFEVKPRSVLHRLYHGETRFDFIGRRAVGFTISGLIILISVFSLGFRGLNLGIDFKGGVVWEFPSKTVSVSNVRDALTPFGLSDAKVQTLVNQGTGERRMRVETGPQTEAKIQQVTGSFETLSGTNVDRNSVGPSWGKQITDKALKALIYFFIAITLYITLRFEWKMAAAALAAMVHDVGISVGVYSIFGFTVSPATVIAFLTILGYSLYDTIVVFDKVHDNTRRVGGASRTTYSDVVNLSMNQVLMRSLNTSLCAILPVLSLLIVGSWMLGAVALQDFAVALLVGLITGSYSSIYIATPLLAILKEREPRYRALAKARVGAPLSPVAAMAVASGAADPNAARVLSPGSAGSGAGASNIARPVSAIPPRPRKKGRTR